MSDITLVNLNLLFVRYVDFIEKELHVPLGPLYLVSVLERAGIDVDFRDYQCCEAPDPFETDRIVEFCSDPAPIIGLSCMANLLPFAILAARDLKAKYPDRVIVLGGVGPKSVEPRILTRFPWIDIVAHGEGERSMVDLVRALADGGSLDDVPGLYFRQDGEVRMTPPAGRIEDLDEIPFPAFHRIDLKTYEGYGMVTSRGCPYACSFCSVAPIWGRAPTFRSPENIIAEMRILQEEAGVDLFLFQDEFFVASKARVLQFCDALKKSGLRARWKAFGRVDLTDRETMEAMAAAGCIELRYGVESGAAHILERTRKGFLPEQATDVVAQALKVFPRVDSFFIWGFPFESMEDFYQTLFQMVSFRLMGSRVLPSLLCLLPQTDLYAEVLPDLKLEFSAELLPEYMTTGHEVRHTGRISTTEVHPELFEFISGHPDIFSGFFLHDLEGNVLPKFRILQDHGFYTTAQRERLETAPSDTVDEMESCGAHSPRT